MTRKEFDVLYFLLRNTGSVTQRILAEKVGTSLGSINSITCRMQNAGWIDDDYKVTRTGLQALEPYKVHNAVIMAAGMSSRFAPLSFENPKALLKVRDEILIEREIRQLQEAGISDITLVVGYMKEKLFYLEDKFEVNIVVNEDYYQYNNTSTLMRVLDKLGNTYICSSDNYFTENVFEPYVYKAYYSAEYAEGRTNEWCLEYNKDGRITFVHENGGADSWYMLGHVYFSNEFSDAFKEILIKEYDNPLTKANLWEDLYARYIGQLDMQIKKYAPGVINEFDSLDELRSFDPKYVNNTNSEIFRNICAILGCEEKDIINIVPIKKGLTNISFLFECNGRKYVYRHPGKGTEKYISRCAEADAMQVAKKLRLDDTFVHIDGSEGWKVSYFIEDAIELDYRNKSHVSEALRMLHELHSSGEQVDFDFDIWSQIDNFIDAMSKNHRMNDDVSDMADRIDVIKGYLLKENSPKVLCHNDSYSPNFLVDRHGKIYLIDWEYAGMSDPGTDLGTFIACSDYTVDEAIDIIHEYLGHKPSHGELTHYFAYIAVAAFYWFVWSVYQNIQGADVGDWQRIWYKYSKQYTKKTLELMEGSHEQRK